MPKDQLTELGEYLKSVRNKANLTQEQLATLSHVSVKHIADVEKGKKNPSFIVLQALAKTLDFSLDNLIRDGLETEEQEFNQLKSYYLSCPPEMRQALLNTVHTLAEEMSILSNNLNVSKPVRK